MELSAGRRLVASVSAYEYKLVRISSDPGTVSSAKQQGLNCSLNGRVKLLYVSVVQSPICSLNGRVKLFYVSVVQSPICSLNG